MRDGGLLDQRPPRALTREGRVALLAEVAAALVEGRAPSREAALFCGSALGAWLRIGGAAEAHFRVGAPRGSHATLKALAARLIADEGKRGEK